MLCVVDTCACCVLDWRLPEPFEWGVLCDKHKASNKYVFLYIFNNYMIAFSLQQALRSVRCNEPPDFREGKLVTQVV